MTSRIYLDHAATTPLSEAARQAMAPFLDAEFGNASTLYSWGRRARRALDDARDQIAQCIGAAPAELIFTSGGTEANNAALKGIAWSPKARGRHLIVSAIEHHSVLEVADFLAEQGWEVSRVGVDAQGRVDPEAVRKALRPDTALVSVMLANNEIGTLQPIAEIAALCRTHGTLLHTDAVQAVGHIPVDVRALNCDLLSLAAHKFGGPKGAGALYCRRGTPIVPFVHGGGQERERRGGTENVAGIAGMAAALGASLAGQSAEIGRQQALRDRLISGLLALDGVRLNGDAGARLPGNVNVCIEGAPAEPLLLNLDMEGVAASSGSACSSGSLEASHVLLALGRSRAEALSGLRLTLGPDNDAAQIERALEIIARCIARVRRATAVV
ncbi:MAG TPA: cysteine desulfurase family protein [Limnochordia bacterium]|nr:cysteine desulfurase family protein [Limnochordia bacterium]